ncbi:hypothetical protein KZ875_31930, partial [Pseudomonas aeruginosa]|nr:hypothetical protein [Pseudomonas aeruginosa]
RPLGQPHYGGIVERIIGTAMQMIHDELPGTTFSNPDQRGDYDGVVCGRGRNPTLRLWPTIFSGKIDVFPGDRRSRLISSMTSVAPA